MLIYSLQADVKIATSDARIGFAGPQVILNTMCEANQTLFDEKCPVDFQAANFVWQHGQIDTVLDVSNLSESVQTTLEATVARVAKLLMPPSGSTGGSIPRSPSKSDCAANDASVQVPAGAADYHFNYTRSRAMERPQTQDIITNVFSNFTELSGDGRVGRDCCLRGGLASFDGINCVVIATFKGHTPTEMQNTNYGKSDNWFRFYMER
jgi:hypothetical protein